VERVEYGGWKNNLRLSNGQAELIATLDVGPRVIRYGLAGGQNVFKEYADQLGRTGETEWMIRGGHRLWAGPEDITRTYALDNGPVTVRELGSGKVRLEPPPDEVNGIKKEIDLELSPQGSQVKLVHRIRNVGQRPTELAVWALTVMAPGGVEIIPLPPKRPHPGSPKNARSAADFAPNQLLSVWPFTDLADARWHFGAKCITLHQDTNASVSPTKLGLAHRGAWVGYLRAGTLFVKRFAYQEGKAYPDQGCNFETFTNSDMLEVESLGPLVKLQPGEAVEHLERWELLTGIGPIGDEASIEREVLARVRPE
jgi:hypothetical protein